MRNYYLNFLFTLIPFIHLGQGWNAVGSRSASLAHATVSSEDVWSYFHNPGATASIKSFSAGVYYETRFLTKELQTQSLVLALPLKKGVLTAGGQFYGYEQYRNTRAGLGYALQLSEIFQLGVQGNLQTLRLGNNYGSTISGTIEGGLLVHFNTKWQMGFSVLNIGRQKINPINDRFATILRGGLCFKPSKKLSIYSEIEKQVITKLSVKGGIEYSPMENLFLRIGAHSGPMEFAFGLGYKNRGFSIDLHSQYHPVLGWSPGFGLNYQIQKK